jgi:acetyl-CoA carboxylase biotin carboxyl carrier protein
MSDLASKVEQLGELLAKHGLTSIRVKEGDQVIEVRRDLSSPKATIVADSQQVRTDHSNAEAAPKGQPVPSPMVGTFYRRPLPTDPPYVEEGQRIERGDVIGVIEAMKVFNEVESPIGGVVRKFLASDGQLVQEGEPLLLIEP